VAKPAELGSDDILVRKGGARGVDPRDSDTPEVEAPEKPETHQPQVQRSQNVVTRGRAGVPTETAPREPVVLAVTPDPLMKVPMKNTPLVLPEPDAERLRDMSYKTRRSQQSIMREFISKGLDDYWRSINQ
jgi:hypothetical protein